MSPSHFVAPVRRLPGKPNLNQLKKQAKALLKAIQVGEPVAIAEVRAHHPDFTAGVTTHSFQLSDAQLVLARAYGFGSWPKLKAYVDGVTVRRFVAAVEAGSTDQVEAMLRQRPELVHTDTSENNELRGLHYAVMRRDLGMVRLLMEAGSDGRKGVYPHRDATTALALARDRGYAEIVAVIEEEEQRRRERASCPNTSVSPAQDRINAAIRSGDRQAAMRLLKTDAGLIRACDRDGATPLHVAAQAMDEEMVAWLLEKGAKPNKRDLRGLTPVDRAVLAVDPRNDSAQKFPGVARLLLDRGVDVTLHAAVALGDAERIRELVAARPGVLREGHWWQGGLVSLAVKHGRADMVRLLLDLGADVDERMMLEELEEPALSWGAPLWYAALAGRRDIAELLLDRGARLDMRDELLKSTPLGWACRWGRKELVELFIKRGAPVDEPDAEPWATPLAWARKMKHAEIERHLQSLRFGP
jgi:ankyrin repeat protein